MQNSTIEKQCKKQQKICIRISKEMKKKQYIEVLTLVKTEDIRG